MRATILIALLVLLAVCFAALPAPGTGRRGLWRQRGQRGDREAPRRGLWRNKFNRRAAQEESDAEFIGFLAPIAFNLIKNKLAKRDDFDEESEFINWKKVWGVAKDIGKTYLSSKYGVNLDEEEEESDQRAFDFGANVNNGNWNVNAGLTGQTRNGGSYNIGGNVANGGNWGVNGGFSGQTRNGGTYNVGGNIGNGGNWGVNGGYQHSWNNGNSNFNGNVGYGSGGFNAGVKFTHRFDDIEEADFINFKKIWGVAKDIGKTYLSNKYGINLDEQEESDSEFIKINWKKIGNIAKDIGKTYLSSKYGINLDEAEDEEESDSADAYSQVAAAGIPISSSGRCNNRNVRSCTSLDGVRANTLNGILTLKRASGCPITITGGTEVGHAGGQYSHSNGYKLDISLNSCIDGYITRNFANIGRRGDGAQQYRASSGNVYAREGNHWDITFY